MKFGDIARGPARLMTILTAGFALALGAPALAQDEAAAAAPTTSTTVAPAQVDATAAETTDAAATTADAAATGGYTPLGPDMIKGQPVDGRITFQDQYSPTGEQAIWMHDVILLPVIFAISLLVLFLLLWVMAKYRKKANPVPSKTSHNTLIEIIWTFVPVIILLVIAVPSIQLLLAQYKSPEKDALTVKVNGYQWYWGYEYPDNGGFEVLSNMLDEAEAIKRGEPAQLAVDNRMVVPVGEEIRIQTFGKDVIHSFAVPSLWFKLDAVPGRINEKKLFIKEPGIYYGQCSELCGARHGYMPIAVEAVPRPQFEAWLASKGGTVRGADEEAAPTTGLDTEQVAPASAEEGAPAAGEAPTQDTAPGVPGAMTTGN